MAATHIAGGCLCGRVRYRTSPNLHSLNNCHRIDCRRASGAPFVTWGTVDSAALQVDGEVRWLEHAGRVRGFAACCGTTLFFLDQTAAEATDLAIATLDDPTPFAPEMNIWTEDQLPWVPLDPQLPAYRRSRSHERS